jgi:hypothetical protein
LYEHIFYLLVMFDIFRKLAISYSCRMHQAQRSRRLYEVSCDVILFRWASSSTKCRRVVVPSSLGSSNPRRDCLTLKMEALRPFDTLLNYWLPETVSHRRSQLLAPQISQGIYIFYKKWTCYIPIKNKFHPITGDECPEGE